MLSNGERQGLGSWYFLPLDADGGSDFPKVAQESVEQQSLEGSSDLTNFLVN